jgi:hypothetical protein
LAVGTAACATVMGAVSLVSLGIGAVAHGLACWGEQSTDHGGFTRECKEALIDAATLPISYFGGKAFEPFAEGMAGPVRGGFMGLCDWIGDQFADIAKKLGTGGEEP